MKKSDKYRFGFSIIEILCIVLILVLLAKFAFPIYSSFYQRSNREIAKVALRAYAGEMEKFYSTHGSYLESDNSWPQIFMDNFVTASNGKVYSLSFTPQTPSSSNQQAYSIVATPITNSIQASDSSGNLCINQSGTILENTTARCNTEPWNKDLCKNGTTLPAIGVCTWSNSCSGATICGSCSAGSGYGSCSNSYIGGDCSGECNNSFIAGSCNGNCTNSTVCGSCNGNCSGISKTDC